MKLNYTSEDRKIAIESMKNMHCFNGASDIIGLYLEQHKKISRKSLEEWANRCKKLGEENQKIAKETMVKVGLFKEGELDEIERD